MMIEGKTHPLVISIPIHVGNMIRYKNRRFGFLYHGTLSSATKREMIGSLVVPPTAILSPEANGRLEDGKLFTMEQGKPEDPKLGNQCSI